jgi:hypothetical protein
MKVMTSASSPSTRNVLNSSREPDTTPEILESSVGPQRIEGRTQQDGWVESRFIGLVQPDHRLVLIAEPHIHQGDIGGSWRASKSLTILIASSFRPETA